MISYFNRLMNDQTASGRVICWIIIIVWAVYTVMAVSVLAYYTSISRRAGRLKTGRELGGGGGFFRRIQAGYEDAVRKGVRDIGETGIIENAVSTAIKSFEYIIHYLPSLATILGLMGTFVGLTSAIAKMDLSMDGLNAIEDIVNNINAPIADMSTAFYTSLVGIVASAVMSIFERVARINIRGGLAFQDVKDYMNEEYLNAILSGMSPQEKYQITENDPAAIAWTEASRRIAKALQGLKESVDKMTEDINSLEQRGLVGLSNSMTSLIRVYQNEHEDVSSVSESMRNYMTMLQGLGKALEQNSRAAGSYETLLEQLSVTYKMLAEEHRIYENTIENHANTELMRTIKDQLRELMTKLERAAS